MRFNDYINSLPSSISEVKIMILKKLWHSDSCGFPKPWVSSAELLQLTGQKYFDRRARELRDQIGCNIETMQQAGLGHAWRIKSPSMAVPQDREYLSQPHKDQLFSSAGYACVICGKNTPPGVRGLQADHKVPVSRGGTNSVENWQAICNHCNVGKRRACEGCVAECASCSWAYPETRGINTLVAINKDTLSSVTAYSKITNKSISSVFEDAAILYIKNKSQ